MNVSLINSTLGVFWVLIVGCLVLVVHIAFALGVWLDVQRMTAMEKRSTFAAGGFIWTLAVLVGGVFVLTVYWLIHHSTLRRENPTAD